MRTPKQIFRKCRVGLIAAFFFSGCINLLMLATPLYTLQVFERVIPTASLETLGLLSAIVAAALVTLALLEVARDRILIRTGHRLDRELSAVILDAGLRAGVDGATLEKRAKSAMMVRNVLAGPSINAIFDAPWTPIFIIVLFLLHPWLGTVTLAASGLLLAMVILQIWSSSERYRDMSGTYEESENWRGAISRDTNVAIALGLAPAAGERFSLLNRGQMSESLAYAQVSANIKAFGKFVRFVAQAAIFGVGAALVVTGEIGAGTLIASSILMGRALAPLEQSVMSFRWVKSAWNAVAMLKKIDVSASDRIALRDQLPTGELCQGTMRLADVNYYPPGARVPALRTVSLSVTPGECVAIVGPNGSGKSALLGVLSGALQPTSGHAELDGVPIRDWQLMAQQARIGYLPEHISLYAGTVQDNISRFNESSLLAVANAGMRAGVHELITSLPKGYDTEIDARGLPLTPLEQRAVALARTLYGEPGILVLDTPEAGLDRRRENALKQILADLKDDGFTIILATQRPDLMTLADTIAVLSSGGMERSGPADTILRSLSPGGSSGEPVQSARTQAQPVASVAAQRQRQQVSA